MKLLRGLTVVAGLCVAVAPALAQQPVQTRRAQQQVTQGAQPVQLRGQQTQVQQDTPNAAPQTAPQRHPTPPPPTDQPVTSNVVVPANQVWQAAATNLRAGGRLQVAAQGQWTMRGQTQRVAAAQVASQFTGPDGYPDLRNERALLPSANIGALIGRIGENGAPFLIGASYDQPIPADGTLFVAMNDIIEQFGDNQGRMAILVTVSPPPPPPEETPQTQAPPAQQPPTTTTATTTTTTPAQATTFSLPLTPDQIRIGIIALAVLVGLLLLGRLVRTGGNRTADDQPPPGAGQITTRLVAAGIANQSLILTVKGR